MRRLRSYLTPLRLTEIAAVLVVMLVTFWELHPNLVLSNTLMTGGDVASHVAAPAYLRTQGNLFDLTPWYPGWFDGMPIYTYYFVLPDFLAVLGSYVIGFAHAFKLATILGSMLMPGSAYLMGRLFGARKPIPAALALATLPFLFDASFTIDGGNLFSTMAGEYAFSLSLAAAMVTIGLFARGMRTGKGYWLAALALSVTLAAHVLPWLFAIGAIIVTAVFEIFQRLGHGDPRDHLVRGDLARPGALRRGRRADLDRVLGVVALQLRDDPELHELDGLHQRPDVDAAPDLHDAGLVHLERRRGGRPLGDLRRGAGVRGRLHRARPPGHDPGHADGAQLLRLRLRPPERDLERAPRALLVHHDPPHRRVVRRLPAVAVGVGGPRGATGTLRVPR